MENVIAVIAIAAILAAALFYIYKEKKSGKKCIGCPDSGSCSGNCGSCGGGCCGGEEEEK